MLNKLKTAVWFLKNPKYLPQVLQVLKREKNGALENSSEKATQWCKDNSVETGEALNKLVNLHQYSELIDLYPSEIQEANFSADAAPVKMGGGGAASFIYHLVKKSNAGKIIETGVAYGWSSLAILLAIKEKENARLISNDMPYVNMGNEDYVGCVVPEKLRDKWDLQRLPDVKGIPLALKKFDNSIDFCHYDSDKSYMGRMWASPLLWNALEKGSFFVSDDINDNLAFKHFCESVDRKPVIVEHLGKYVGVIVK
jgi:predicted O-methyltransferase YrrM